jgi:hypothetical protein
MSLEMSQPPFRKYLDKVNEIMFHGYFHQRLLVDLYPPVLVVDQFFENKSYNPCLAG